MEDSENSREVPWKASGRNITGIIVDEGITRISNYAFYDCSKLQKASLPESADSGTFFDHELRTVFSDGRPKISAIAAAEAGEPGLFISHTISAAYLHVFFELTIKAAAPGEEFELIIGHFHSKTRHLTK